MTFASASLRDSLVHLGLQIDRQSYVEVAELGSTHGVWWSVINRKQIAKYLTDARGTFIRGWVMTPGEKGRVDVQSARELLEHIERVLS